LCALYEPLRTSLLPYVPSPPSCAAQHKYAHPPRRRAHPLVEPSAPPRRRARLLTDVHTPLQTCTSFPPPFAHARTHVRLHRNSAHPPSTNMLASYSSICAFMPGGRTRYIRGRDPSYPHSIALGFVSWDSFVGSLHEAVGMVRF
jgi:hypothetical protein